MPGQQIQKGTTYVNYPTPGTNQVTAENLNDHVDNAILLPGAISGQTESAAQINDYVMSERSGSLFKYALSSIRDLFSAYFLLRSGGSMTGELTLSSSTPSGSSIAASKGYVDTTAAAAAAAVSTLPGAIVMWGGASIPTGWLECNGQSTSTYTNLAAIYGANLPDLRGSFVRGWDNGKGLDPGRELGSYQADAFASHSHTLRADNNNQNGLSGNLGGNGTNFGGFYPDRIGSTGGTETRPKNVALRFIVKT
jgi:hypothetical protein